MNREMEEIEAKFLDIDVPALVSKLESLGSQKIADYSYKRKLFDFPDGRLNAENKMIRLRDEGGAVTFTYKQRFGNANDHTEGGTTEIETTVGDFLTAEKILHALGLVEKIYKENKRTRYVLDGVEVDIDSWPMIPTYLELEAKSWDAIKSVSEKLGLDYEKHTRGSNREIYNLYGIDEASYSVLTFEKQELSQK